MSEREERALILASVDGKRPTDMTEELCVKLMNVIDEYDGVMPLASAIGVLEIIKHTLLTEE